MTRLLIALVVSLCALSPAFGRVAPRGGEARDRSLLPRKQDGGEKEEQPSMIITEATEVRVDGKPCKYENVPKNAEIILLDLGSDQKTIRKIHFRSKK